MAWRAGSFLCIECDPANGNIDTHTNTFRAKQPVFLCITDRTSQVHIGAKGDEVKMYFNDTYFLIYCIVNYSAQSFDDEKNEKNQNNKNFCVFFFFILSLLSHVHTLNVCLKSKLIFLLRTSQFVHTHSHITPYHTMARLRNFYTYFVGKFTAFSPAQRHKHTKKWAKNIVTVKLQQNSK